MDKDENMEGCSNSGWSMDVGEREVVRWEIMSGVGGTINFQLIVTISTFTTLGNSRTAFRGLGVSRFAAINRPSRGNGPPFGPRRIALATLQVVTTAL